MLRRLARRLPAQPEVVPLANADEDFHEAYEQARQFTMTSPERMHALYQAARYVARRGLKGDYVECGVWRGGSSMMAALGFLAEGDSGRRMWLYDTFEGMPPPIAKDVRHDGVTAEEILSTEARQPQVFNHWAYASLADARSNMESTGFPAGRVEYVVGKVEDTIPANCPDQVAILRLDTDWYESTRHELVHLWPRLIPGGVLIVDDYGYWQGSKEAVDEYFADEPPLLIRIDSDGRLVVKP
jgi:predicted O-methyltransferase YrrM